MKKKQCQAFIERKGERCQKKIRWGRKYCWWHYPKGGLVLGAFLGLVLTLLLAEPLRRTLSPHWPFHYLDSNPPTIAALSPDVRTLEYAEPNTLAFGVACHDDCSGVDLQACEVNLFHLKGNTREPLSGEVVGDANRLSLTLKEGLIHAKYALQTVICDNAGNRAESEYRFIVPERDIIKVKISCEEYSEAEHRRVFRSFLDEHGEKQWLYERHSLYVCQYILRNTADSTYCRNLHLSIDSQGCVFVWQEVGSMDCNGIMSFNIAESLDKRTPKNMVFTSQRLLDIEEIGPGGIAHFAALVGFANLAGVDPKINSPTDVGVHGNYIAEGYGRSEVAKLGLWVPIENRGGRN